MAKNRIELTKGFLADSIPGLAAALESPVRIRAAFLIRDYASSVANLSAPSLILDQEWYRLGTLRQGTQVMNELLEFRAGVWCGGAAFLLTISLKAAGIPACLYAYGWPDGLSHVTTIFASIPPEGGTARQDFYLLDGYLGYHYEDADREGELLKFTDALRSVAGRDYRRVVPRHVDLARHYLAPPRADVSDSAWLFPGGQVPAPVKRPGAWVYPGAVLNWTKLYATTSPSRHLADQRRDDQPLDDFLLDMLLVNPRLGGIENRFEPCHDDFRQIKRLLAEHGREEGI
jgi:hypothetical protein